MALPGVLRPLSRDPRRERPWVAAPRDVIDPRAAHLEPGELTMPAAFDRLSAPPVFIAGSARSGTTWTFDLFHHHPEVCALNETWVLSQTHGVTSVLTQEYWIPEVADGWRERVDVPFAAIQLLSYHEMVRELGDLVAGWLMRPFGPEHRFLVSKEPLDVRAAAILFPQARFIHVVRDGRNVALSMKRASETWDPTMGVGWPMGLRAEAWRRQVENVRDHADWLGERYMEIRYEDMRADVPAALRRLFDFSGIPYDDDLIERIGAATALPGEDSTARKSGFRGGGERRGWQSDMSLRDAIGFQRAAGQLLVELGYESDGNWWRELLRLRRNGR